MIELSEGSRLWRQADVCGGRQTSVQPCMMTADGSRMSDADTCVMDCVNITRGFFSIQKRQLHLFSFHWLTSIHHLICQKNTCLMCFYPFLCPPGSMEFPMRGFQLINGPFQTFNIQPVEPSFQARCQNQQTGRGRFCRWVSLCCHSCI